MGKSMLCGVEGHISLRFSQLVRQSTPVCYMYSEHSLKNHQEGVAENTDGKVVTVRYQQEARSHFLFLHTISASQKQFPDGTNVEGDATVFILEVELGGSLESTTLKLSIHLCKLLPSL